MTDLWLPKPQTYDFPKRTSAEGTSDRRDIRDDPRPTRHILQTPAIRSGRKRRPYAIETTSCSTDTAASTLSTPLTTMLRLPFCSRKLQ